MASSWSFLSAGSLLSVGSVGSILSIGSAGSVLSIGSSGSILSIGAAGGFLTFGPGRSAPEGDDVDDADLPGPASPDQLAVLGGTPPNHGSAAVITRLICRSSCGFANACERHATARRTLGGKGLQDD